MQFRELSATILRLFKLNPAQSSTEILDVGLQAWRQAILNPQFDPVRMSSLLGIMHDAIRAGGPTQPVLAELASVPAIPGLDPHRRLMAKIELLALLGDVPACHAHLDTLRGDPVWHAFFASPPQWLTFWQSRNFTVSATASP